jgi:hypothetical protein
MEILMSWPEAFGGESFFFPKLFLFFTGMHNFMIIDATSLRENTRDS